MVFVTLSEFLENTEKLVNDTLETEGFTQIYSDKGNLMLMTEHDYDCLLDMGTNMAMKGEAQHDKGTKDIGRKN